MKKQNQRKKQRQQAKCLHSWDRISEQNKRILAALQACVNDMKEDKVENLRFQWYTHFTANLQNKVRWYTN